MKKSLPLSLFFLFFLGTTTEMFAQEKSLLFFTKKEPLVYWIKSYAPYDLQYQPDIDELLSNLELLSNDSIDIVYGDSDDLEWYDCKIDILFKPLTISPTKAKRNPTVNNVILSIDVASPHHATSGTEQFQNRNMQWPIAVVVSEKSSRCSCENVDLLTFINWNGRRIAGATYNKKYRELYREPLPSDNRNIKWMLVDIFSQFADVYLNYRE